MRLLILAAVFAAMTSPAWAANCVAVVFHDPAQPSTNDEDLLVQIAPWNDIQRLKRNASLFKAASVMVFYDQLGAQGGPTLDSGQEEYTISFGPATVEQPRQSLIQSNWNSAPAGPGPESAARGVFTAPLNTSEDVDLTSLTAPAGLERSFMNGQDIALLGETDPAIYDRADALAASIRSDITANGCP